MDEVATFENLPWADSRLLGFTLRDIEGDAHELVFDMALRNATGHVSAAKVSFIDCVGLRLDLDLIGKLAVGNVIADAICVRDSELRTQLLASWDSEWLAKRFRFRKEDVLHYEIELIQPGGKIDILATGFRVGARTDERG